MIDTIQRTFFCVRQLRYFAAILTEQNRSIVIKRTVYCDTRHTVKSTDSHRSHSNGPKSQYLRSTYTVKNGIETVPINFELENKTKWNETQIIDVNLKKSFGKIDDISMICLLNRTNVHCTQTVCKLNEMKYAIHAYYVYNGSSQ